MELIGAVLRAVFQIVSDAHVYVLANLEIVAQTPVLNVLSSAVIQLMFFEPLGIIVAKEPPTSSFAKSKQVCLVAVGCIFDVEQVTKVECPEFGDDLIDVSAEFTRVGELVRGSCAVVVFSHVLQMARNRCLVNVPVERCSDGEILAAPVKAHNAVVVAVAFVFLLHVLGFANEGAQRIAHFTAVKRRVAAEDFFELGCRKRVDLVFVSHELAEYHHRRSVDSGFGKHLVDGSFPVNVCGVGAADGNLTVKFDIAGVEQPVSIGEYGKGFLQGFAGNRAAASAIAQQRVVNFVIGVNGADGSIKTAERRPFDGSTISKALSLSFAFVNVILVNVGVTFPNQVGLAVFAEESAQFQQRLVHIVLEERKRVACTKDGETCHVGFAGGLGKVT